MCFAMKNNQVIKDIIEINNSKICRLDSTEASQKENNITGPSYETGKSIKQNEEL